jgi:hypothetical protein
MNSLGIQPGDGGDAVFRYNSVPDEPLSSADDNTGRVPGDTPELRPLPRAGQNLSVNGERIQERLGVGIFRVPSDQEKNAKPTLGWRGCRRELERLIKTLLGVCGKIGDCGLAVDAEHYGRGRSLGGQNKRAGCELDFHPLVVAFERQDEKNARVDVGAGDLLPPTVTSNSENVSVRALLSSETLRSNFSSL